MFRLVAILMKAAPIGAFGAMAFTIGKYGIGSIANLAVLVATFYLTSALFVLVVLGTRCTLQRLLDRGAARATSRKSCCWCSAPAGPRRHCPA